MLLIAVFLWRQGKQQAQSTPASVRFAHNPAKADGLPNSPPPRTTASAPARPGQQRLSNTTESLGQLIRNPKAILLENALLDTAQPTGLPIPDYLRASGDPGAYLVQARGPVDEPFRALLRQAGASIVSYIPNNAYLVRASQAAARQLAQAPQTQAVLPYEPYYKLKPWLLRASMEQLPLPPESRLRLLLFADARQQTVAELQQLGLEVLSEEPTPFGPMVEVQPSFPAQPFAGQTLVPALARLPGVQEVELGHKRMAANDLGRATTGVSFDSVVQTNYLDLTGTNVMIAMTDSGVDRTHPDLTNRVFGDLTNSLVDTDGHGTHVAGIIAGDGTKSATVTNASGSIMPAANGQFRGKAPRAKLFSISGGTDSYRQQMAARTNALISNNSWTYGNNDYDLAAASYDAAVRDALSQTTGSQPVLFVFAAGNAGGGSDDGTGGNPDSIQSPATAKNVITVGALEQCRHFTNQPWFGLTATNNRVAGFSSRGNVGIGVEGDFGRFKPDLVAPGVFVVSTRSRDWDMARYYNPTNPALVISNFGNSLLVLSNLNNTLGQAPAYYRYESGTSLAAAEVAGTLALAQEFFEQRLRRTNSPALYKAMLINGARPLGGVWDLCVTNFLNAQGWGRLNLPTSLPAILTNLNSSPAASAMQLFDQDPAEALSTGQSRTRYLAVAANAQTRPLRVTLVWTDPPGNPLAGIKLVNDLDLIVTNLDTGQVYFGNDIPAGSLFNASWDSGSPPNHDVMNNVENVYIAPPLGSEYSVTIVGRRVNVNAVSAQSSSVAQDYALVVSSGDGEVTNALAVNAMPIVSANSPLVTPIPADFGHGATDVGGILLHQHVGASAPLTSTNTVLFGGGFISLGATNQWHFYVVTNEAYFTNAVFLTFLPPTLAVSGLGAVTNNLGSAVRHEADIDLYVSQESGLLSLDPDVIARADKSVGRGGRETILYTNAPAGVYYIGVKSESQEAAEYGFAAVFSQYPFSRTDANGNQRLRGFPVPASIPDATSWQPGSAHIFAVAPDGTQLRRAVVTNSLTHERLSDLAGTLTHGDTAVVLNNHAPNLPTGPVTYDDSAELNVAGAQRTDGPGSLLDFAGYSPSGQWLFTQLDTVPGQTGTNDSAWLWLEAQPPLNNGLIAVLAPGATRQDYIDVPAAATSLSAVVSLLSGTGPVVMQVAPRNPADGPALTNLLVANSSGTLTLDKTLRPPLNAGQYVLRLNNLGPDPVTVSNFAALAVDPSRVVPVVFTATNHVPIVDDAVSFGTLDVTNSARIVSLEAGVRIRHPRISDLVLHLISPSGTRVLLQENRGGASIEGLGLSVITTNVTPVSSSGGALAQTNVLDTGQNSGTISIAYWFYDLPDDMRIYYDNNSQPIFDSGSISNSGQTNINYGPGVSTTVTIIMNEGNNDWTNTAWDYTVTATKPEYQYVTFTEDTNLASGPIKFAAPPFTNLSSVIINGVATNGIFFLPEESLARFAGESALGQWKLEIQDTRAGATNTAPELLSWRLSFVLADTEPAPMPLVHHQPRNLTLGPGLTQYFTLDVPDWASFATNSLLAATAPLNLLLNQSQLPSGTNGSGDFPLLPSCTNGRAILSAAGPLAPLLLPGQRCYLAIQNTNPFPVTFTFEVDFDVGLLANGVPVTALLPVGPLPRYFAYDVSPLATAVSFQLTGLDGDADLYARFGLPFPTPTAFNYGSANPPSIDEQIVVFASSAPVALAPGRWYLGVFNADTRNVDVNYTILATEYSIYGPSNAVIADTQLSSSNLCITWSSVSGLCYYVEGATNLVSPWTAISSTIPATDILTSFCIPLPSPLRFFRVQQGVPPGTNLPPVTISSLSATSTGGGQLQWQLQWQASSNALFQVQWSPTLNPPVWNTIPGIASSPDGQFLFLDDGSQTGSFDGTRFYRLIELP